MAIRYEPENKNINTKEVTQPAFQPAKGESSKKYVDNAKPMLYNVGVDGGTTTYTLAMDNYWKDKNKDSMRYAGDGAKKSIDAGLKEAPDFMADADKGTNFEDVQNASVKRKLANDSGNTELADKASMEMIGHLSDENKEDYLKHSVPLQTYIDAKDEYDYKHNSYTTTEFLDTTPDEGVRQVQQRLNELGYTDKFGEKLKEDGIEGAKTLYAKDKYEADNKSATDYESATQKYRNSAGLTSRSGNARAMNVETQPVKIAGVFDDFKSAASAVTNVAKDAASKITWENLSVAREQNVSYTNIKDAYLLGTEADKRAREYALEDDPQYTADGNVITWGNDADAYRHFTWNYEMAEKLGYSQALKISSAHEIAYLRIHNLVTYTYTGDVYDRKAFMTPQMLMDVWNNLKGVNAYAEFKNKKYNYEKAYEILTARNALVSSEDEALKAYGFTQDDVTTKKVGNEDLRGVWVYFNYKNGYITNIRKVED